MAVCIVQSYAIQHLSHMQCGALWLLLLSTNSSVQSARMHYADIDTHYFLECKHVPAASLAALRACASSVD
jgi:hypothetical protein